GDSRARLLVLELPAALDSDQQPTRERGGDRQRLPVPERAHASDRKAGVAFQHLLNEFRGFTCLPQLRRVNDAVAKRPAVRARAARDRAWDAHELGAHFIPGEPHLRVAMSASVDEFEMRRKLAIGKRPRPFEVEALRIFEGRADAVLDRHVVRPVRPCRTGAVDQVQLPQRKLVARAVLEGFHRAGARQRGADEAEAHWLELPRWKLRRRVPRPEAVAVARHDRKARDLRIADEVVDLATLEP